MLILPILLSSVDNNNFQFFTYTMKHQNTFTSSRTNKSSFTKYRTHSIHNPSNYSTIVSPVRMTHRPCTASTPYPYRKVNQVQEEIGRTIGDGLNRYVKNKLRFLTNKHNQAIYSDGVNLGHSLNTNDSVKSRDRPWKWSKNKPRNLQQMKICEVGRDSHVKVERVVGYPFIVNTQEQLARMVSKSKESQAKYRSLQSQISEMEREKMRMQKHGDKYFQNPEHVSDVAWDAEWNLSNLKQIDRYRCRVASKHKRKFKPITIQW